jgi:hypothetical protein
MTLAKDMTRTLLLQVGVKFILGQGHRTPGILVVSILSLEVSSGLRIQDVPHMNKDSTPITVFLLFLMELIQLLMAETNKYYNQRIYILDNDSRCS